MRQGVHNTVGSKALVFNIKILQNTQVSEQPHF